MPHYFFNVRNGTGFVADHEGVDPSGLEAARVEAPKGACSIVAGEVVEGRLDLGGAIEVEEGHCLLTMTDGEAVAGCEAGRGAT